MEEERVFYICCATENQIVNLQPLLALGLGRVAAVIMLIAHSNPATVYDNKVAIQPARRLRLVLRKLAKEQGIAAPPITALEDTPDAIERWHDAVSDAMRDHGPGIYVLNLTGGTRATSLGALGGLQTAVDRMGNRISTRAILYMSGPARIVEVYPSFDARPEYLESAAAVNLRRILELRGYYEQDSAGRRRAEARADEWGALTRQIYECLVAPDDEMETARKLALLHSVVAPLAARKDWPKGAKPITSSANLKRPHRRIVDAVIAACRANGVDLLSFNRQGDLEFSGEDVVRYLAGGWFEEYVYLACRDSIPSTSPSEVALRVNLQSDPEQPRLDGELDVVVRVGAELHVVECKAGAFGGQTRISRKDAGTVGSWKRNLVGPYGSAALFCLQAPASSRSNRDNAANVASQAAHDGVHFWAGTAGMKAFREWLAEIG